MEVIARNGNYVVSSSFGSSIIEGTQAAGTNGQVISFNISQINPQYNSFFWQIEPINGSYADFWNDFSSNKIGGEPADAFALSGFTSGNFSVKINPDNVIEPNENFKVSFYLSNLDRYNGIGPVSSAQFTIIDDDTPAPIPTSSANGLIQYKYYYDHNPDIKSAGLSPETHYNDFGWHEGRDPNAFFFTSGYLAANSDVRTAGLNPLSHYDSNGWKEGRDPSAGFDNELYLSHNADVKAAGIDPLSHYLSNGQAEGRQAYAAVGKAGDLGTHPGFDAEYYLLANADVARAAISAGGDSFAYAYNHYETYGWHEGRNPNAVFDTKGYLTAYSDVKSANIDPLAHYDLYGFKEGRDPSVNFDTKAYESHYTDVAKAGIDPMLHYLQYGAVEGRSAFADGHFG